MESFSEVLNLVKDSLKSDISDVAYKCWIAPIEAVKLEGNNAHICVANPFHKDILENQYKNKLEKGFAEILGFPVSIVIQTTESVQAEPLKSESPSVLMDENRDSEELESYNKALDYMENQQNKLNESLKNGNYEYTFDTFIVGSSNNFAYAACKAVAQKNSTAYNPLFIHGPSGLGKTHLLHAIKFEFAKNNPNANIIYVSSETFTNELINAIQKQTIGEFRNKYRKADILLIDDIQFIAGKESTQEEFFHTFNELHQIGKQIVLTSDRPPKDIKTLEDRLKTRFEWGLLTDIGLPDFETRIAIIKRKADLLNLTIPDDVAQFIASKLKNNIRQLEGAVKKIKAYKYYAGSNPSMSVAQTVIKEILNDNQPAPITVEKIIEEVAKTYSVTPEDIRSNKRTAPLPLARQVSIYVVREITQMTQAAIGDEFGGRDHATIVYSIQKVQKIIEKDSHTKAIVDDIIKNIRDK
ncbi:chromosomal replication initiator protein DnaA [Massiliimalia massiliensis]|jgi:chromosomal replication initiator protein|uniref:chromosomal replication initiator protein DnaA n=1 Tax=Massiliimalia massiliensis TaxID=1852384 RepID=UPI0009863356|nr:chromosomal replication initiator protein DnaA [Massiliimalia massiliensis]